MVTALPRKMSRMGSKIMVSTSPPKDLPFAPCGRRIQRLGEAKPSLAAVG
jgi:hypothetical protein